MNTVRAAARAAALAPAKTNLVNSKGKLKVIKRNTRATLWGFVSLLGCILAGAIVGEGLRLFGLIGHVIFWLIIGFHSLLIIFFLVVLFSVWREGKLGSYQGGSLNEYLWLSLLFDSGLMPGLWMQSASFSENALVIVPSSLLLVAAIFVFTIS